jgi:hypothetical protein
VTCPGTGKCKIEIDNAIQFGNGSTAANNWAVWEKQGTNESVPGSQFMGYIPADGSYLTGSDVEELSGVLPGTRLIQPILYSSGGASVGYYIIVIRVYAS